MGKGNASAFIEGGGRRRAEVEVQRRRSKKRKKPALSFPFLSPSSSFLSLSLSLPFLRLDLVQLCQPLQDHPLARLRDLPSGDKLVQNQVNAVEVEDQIKLADVAKVVIEHFDKEVDGLQESQLVIGRVAGDGEVEPGVAAIDDLEGLVLEVVFFGFWESGRARRGGEQEFFVVVVVEFFRFRRRRCFPLHQNKTFSPPPHWTASSPCRRSACGRHIQEYAWRRRRAGRSTWRGGSVVFESFLSFFFRG